MHPQDCNDCIAVARTTSHGDSFLYTVCTLYCIYSTCFVVECSFWPLQPLELSIPHRVDAVNLVLLLMPALIFSIRPRLLYHDMSALCAVKTCVRKMGTTSLLTTVKHHPTLLPLSVVKSSAVPRFQTIRRTRFSC